MIQHGTNFISIIKHQWSLEAYLAVLDMLDVYLGIVANTSI